MKTPSTLMLIEDDDLDVEAIRRVLRKLSLDLSIVRAHDGEEALDWLRPPAPPGPVERPFAVLLDLNMPRMSGLELLRELQGDPVIAGAPIYILTTSDSLSDRQAASELGVDGYLVKPITAPQMIDVLASLAD